MSAIKNTYPLFFMSAMSGLVKQREVQGWWTQLYFQNTGYIVCSLAYKQKHGKNKQSKIVTIINNSQLKEKGWCLVKLQDRKDTELLLCQMERRWVLNMPWLSTLGLESAILCLKQPACLCLPMPESLLTLLKKENIYLMRNRR